MDKLCFSSQESHDFIENIASFEELTIFWENTNTSVYLLFIVVAM